ncbi:Symbiosis-related disease resistance protein [Rhynchospora pubera]|uniref:Symbiosis-related disease resistance protein n=1 Tax=Rhynchospora pubera TaxID=906938 RepID=A0AAV8FZ37_9POAL|nr:Symbiosis-related disease resistance protein [Rhynchospora pubera]
MNLAVGAGQWFAQFVLEKYADSKLEEWAAKSCLDVDVKTLTDYLQTSQAMLDALGDKPIGNDRFPPLLLELKLASYEADDVLDELDYYRLKELVEGETVQPESSAVQRVTGRAGEFFLSWLSRALRFIHRLFLLHANENESLLPEAFCVSKTLDKDAISGRMKAASSRLKKAMMSVDSVVQLQRFAACAQRPIDSANYRETSSLLTEPKVFGRDKEKETMIENMLAPHGKDQKYGNFSVLPIVGIGGVGKTTLAQSLYNDPRIMRSFMVRAWACASDALNTLDVRKLTIDITLSIDKEGSFNLSMMNDLDKIQQRLIKEISGKKFLIVIDDVWVTSRWEVLIAPLSYGMAGSIVIVTTREQNIGKRLGSMPTVTLTGLEKDLFWDFFVQNAFMGKSPEDHPTLVSIGQDIIAKLHGIPLAAKTVGRLLNKKLDEAHWFSILNSELWELRQAPDDIIPVLKLSYQFFSVHVQRCFSYCSVFPKDHLFTEEELLSTWIAQGFTDIQPGDKSPEHVAQDYLNELLSSSFFQPKDGYYLMHDLLHDLAISVSQDECHGCGNLLHLPKGIVNLIKLRHLIADGRHYLGRIPGIGKMTCLQELDAFYIEKELGHKIIELKELQELRGSLRVHNLDNVENGEEASQAKLKEKRYLTELRFSWDNPSFPSPPDVSADVLESVCPPPFLKRLDIIGYNGTRCPTCDMEGGAHEVTAFTDNQERALELLTSLQTLVFKNCRNLQILPEMLYRMLKLKELHVVQCNMIESLPDNGLPASLEVLVIDRNSRLDTRCQGAEQHKIAHVREVKYFS